MKTILLTILLTASMFGQGKIEFNADSTWLIVETKFEALAHRVESLQKLVYIGLGVILAIQAILAYFI